MTLNFDIRSVAPSVGRDPVPNGKYKVVIKKTNIGPTKDGQNGALKVNADIIDGPYSGKSLFKNFNIYHSNPEASSIAYAELSALGWVLGVYQMQDTTQEDNMLPALHGKPHIWIVSTAANSKTGKMQNNVDGFEDIYGNGPDKLAAGQGGQQPQMGGPPPSGPPQPAPQAQQWGGSPPPSAAPQGQQWGAPQGGPPQGAPAPGGPPPGQWNGGPTQPQQHNPPPSWPQQGNPSAPFAPQGGYAAPPPQPGGNQWGGGAPQGAPPQGAPQGQQGSWPQQGQGQPGGPPPAPPQGQQGGSWAPQSGPGGGPPPIPWNNQGR